MPGLFLAWGDSDVAPHDREGDGDGIGKERQALSKRLRNTCLPPPLDDVEGPHL